MARPRPFRLEELENRLVPALFGIPWADARHLTLSFVPDGTPVDGVGSTLFGSMHADTGLAPAAWQAQILKAVEAWAQAANINVGVVPDGGQPIGTPGAPEGDPRFGDIRISARPLSTNVLAITEPPGPLGDTRAGDIEINSAAAFSVGGAGFIYDLYSTLLQEAGHAFGINNSLDPASPMYESYGGVRVGPTAGDVANIQALYGPRPADAFEGPGGNNTFATARDISAASNFYAYATPVLQADITTPADGDYFKVQTAASNPNGLTFQVNAGMSLLAAKLTVMDAAGAVLTTVQMADPQTGVLTATLATVAPNAYYYVKVEAAGQSFAVGGYQLAVVFNPAAPILQEVAPLSDSSDDIGATIGTATNLSTSSGFAANTHYDSAAVLQTAGAANYYQILSPQVAGNQQNVLTVTARALDPTALAPTVQVYDANQQPVAVQVLANGNGTYIVQIGNAAPGQNFYVKVAGQSGGTGAYELTADFRSQAIALQQLTGGTLTAAGAVNFTSLTIYQSEVMYFALSAGTVPAGLQAGVRMGVFDTNGHVVSTLFAKAGQTVTASVFLAPGEYVVRFEGLTPAGVALPNLGYTLQGIALTDPIDPLPGDPMLGGTPTGPDFTVGPDAGLAYLNLILDTLGSVIW